MTAGKVTAEINPHIYSQLISDEGAKATDEKRMALATNDVEISENPFTKPSPSNLRSSLQTIHGKKLTSGRI